MGGLYDCRNLANDEDRSYTAQGFVKDVIIFFSSTRVTK